MGQHRALVFCQLKAMMDIVENDLFRSSMPSVAYLRLDGSIPPSDRHEIVTKFNNDVSIDLLLLTTSVGEYILWKIFLCLQHGLTPKFVPSFQKHLL